MRVGSSNSRWRLAQRRPAARSSNQSRSAAVPPRASCWRRHCNTSVPATVVQSLKAEACANAIQIHTAVRADTQGPKAGGPAQRGSTANEAPADQRSPLSQWPPSTVDTCRMTPLTSTALANGSEQILSVNQGSRTIPKQGIAAPTGPKAGIPRNHQHGALHPARPAGRNQCSAALRTLHHHERLGKGHQPTVSIQSAWRTS